MGVSGHCGGILASAPSGAEASPGGSLTRAGEGEGSTGGGTGGHIGGHVVEGVAERAVTMTTRVSTPAGRAVGPPTGSRGDRKPRKKEETRGSGGEAVWPGKKMRKRDAIPRLIYPRSYAPYRDAG